MAAKDVDEKQQWSEIRKGTRMFLLKILRWLNYVVLACSVLAIIFMLALRLVPTPWGWCFIAFSCFAISCSIVGCINSTALSSFSSSSPWMLRPASPTRYCNNWSSKTEKKTQERSLAG